MTSAQPAFPPLFTTPLPASQTASSPIPLPVSECVTEEKGLFSHRNRQCNPDRLWGGLTPSLAGHTPCTITRMLCHVYLCCAKHHLFPELSVFFFTYLSHSSMSMSQLDHYREIWSCELKDKRKTSSLVISLQPLYLQ